MTRNLTTTNGIGLTKGETMAEKIQLTEKALALFRWLDKQPDSRDEGKGHKVNGTERKAFEELMKKGLAKNVGKGAGFPTHAFLLKGSSAVDPTAKKPVRPLSIAPVRPGMNMKQTVKPEDLRKIADDWDRAERTARHNVEAAYRDSIATLTDTLAKATEAKEWSKVAKLAEHLQKVEAKGIDEQEVRAESYKALDTKVYPGAMRRVLELMK